MEKTLEEAKELRNSMGDVIKHIKNEEGECRKVKSRDLAKFLQELKITLKILEHEVDVLDEQIQEDF